MFDLIRNFDLTLLAFIYEYLRNPVFDKIMIFFTMAGENSYIWIAISIILIFEKKYRRIGILALCSILFSALLGDFLLKNIIQRARPLWIITHDVMLIDVPHSYSFPSGHTTHSFAAAGIISKGCAKYRIWAYVLAGIISFSRMYLYVHYPTDIIGGIIVGLASAGITLRLYKRIYSEI